MAKEQEIIRTSLRIPKALYDRLEKSAEERGLTMHADILSRLETSFMWSDTDPEFRSLLSQKDAHVVSDLVTKSVIDAVERALSKHGLGNYSTDKD